MCSTCVSWKFQTIPVDVRTCKHLESYLGHEYNSWRIGGGARALQKVCVCVLCLFMRCWQVEKKAVPGVLLADKYDGKQDIKGWFVSEKLDGVRAYWCACCLVFVSLPGRNGKEFLSRQGLV